MASPYGHYAEILEDILKELQKRKRRKNPPNRFHYRINFRSDRRLLGVAYGLIVVTIIVYFWNSDANSEVIIGPLYSERCVYDIGNFRVSIQQRYLDRCR